MKTKFVLILRSFQMLSDLENREEADIKLATLGTAFICNAGSPESVEYMREPRPCKRALEAFLKTCPADYIYALAALMYSGRDGQPDPITYWADELASTFKDKEDACRAILEKLPRNKYINTAIEKLPPNFDLNKLPASLRPTAPAAA